jgi:hypothetical protein
MVLQYSWGRRRGSRRDPRQTSPNHSSPSFSHAAHDFVDRLEPDLLVLRIAQNYALPVPVKMMAPALQLMCREM